MLTFVLILSVLFVFSLMLHFMVRHQQKRVLLLSGSVMLLAVLILWTTSSQQRTPFQKTLSELVDGKSVPATNFVLLLTSERYRAIDLYISEYDNLTKSQQKILADVLKHKVSIDVRNRGVDSPTYVSVSISSEGMLALKKVPIKRSLK